MENLFDTTVAANILSRIEKLQPGSKALWGKMNVAQMLSHLQAPVEVGHYCRKSLANNLIVTCAEEY